MHLLLLLLLQCAFWVWDKRTPRECVRHTRGRCCVININAERVLNSEIPQTPPSTPVSVRSLPFSLQEPQKSQPRAPEPRRRSASRLRPGSGQNFKRKLRQRNRRKVKIWIYKSTSFKKGKICTVREKEDNQKIYKVNIYMPNFKIESTYKINIDTYRPKL